MLIRRPAAALSGGFTLVELMIFVVILGALAAIATPNFLEWIGNTKIRTVGSTIAEGIQRARLEAVKGNTVDTGGSVTALPETVFLLVGGNGDYRVCARPVGSADTCGSGANALLLSDHNTGGNQKITVSGNTGVIRFNSLGRMIVPNPANGNAVITVVHNDLPADVQRELNVTVTPGGKVKLCDPDPTVPTDDPRHC